MQKVKGGSFLVDEIDYENIFIPEEFSEEQRMIARTMEDFLEQESESLGEDATKLNYELTLKVIKKAGEIGILSACLPEEYGGLGLDGIRFALIKEKLCTGPYSIITIVSNLTGIGMLPIVFFGTQEQRQKYLPELSSGNKTSAFALTESEAGSDAANIKTTAKLSKDGKYYILNGSKVFITNGGFADIFTVFAKIDGRDFSAFIVERDMEGFAIGAEEQKMGLKASSTCSIFLENVKVPVENLLGKAGQGHLIAFNILNFGRLAVGALCLGNSKDAIECSAKYANERIQFGRKISSFPLIGKKLAEMNIKIFALESMVYRTADLFDKILGELDFSDPDLGSKSRKVISEYMLECAIIKVFGSESLDFIADEGVQIHGGYGYVQEYRIESIYRDARIKRILEGTNEIIRILITGTLSKRILKGQFVELHKALEQISEESNQFAINENLEGALEQETYLVKISKKIFLLLFSQVYKIYEIHIEQEQEICAYLSDIIINIFAMESVLLRTKKIIALKDEITAQNAKNMTTTFVYEAFGQIVNISHIILNAIKFDNEHAKQLAKLTKVSLPVNTISLKRQIAAKVIEAEKYVV